MAVKKLIPYFGGKSRVACAIIKKFPPHHTYAEPFAGSLAVLLQKDPSPHEVVNDFDTELVNLYKMTKFRLAELCEAVERLPASRRIWEELLRADHNYLNEIYRAVRKLYVMRLSFGGRGRHFGMDKSRHRFDSFFLKAVLEDFWERTRKVTLECLDACDFLRAYDTPRTFFYLDPVYLGKDDYAQKFGSTEQHQRLVATLSVCKGNWLLSHHDCPEVRELYREFRISKLVVPYTVHGGSASQGNELLISNF